MAVSSFRIENAAEIIRALERTYPALVKNTIDKVFRQTGVIVKQEIRNQWQSKRNKGALDRSIDWGMGNKGGRATQQELSNFSTAPHSIWVENNTRPHVIFPRNKKVLRFLVAGRPVFAKYVFHPGTRGEPAFRDAERRRYFGLGVKTMNAILAELHKEGL